MPPNFVNLDSFIAVANPDSTVLKWETAVELDNAGFHIWRSEDEDGEYRKVTTELLNAEGKAFQYNWKDSEVEAGKSYYYKLEDIDFQGTSTLHGPVKATPGSLRLISPTEGASFTPDTPPTLAWESDDYRHFILKYSFGGEIDEVKGIQSNWQPDATAWKRFAKSLLQQQPQQNIFWQITARDKENNEGVSEIRLFGVTE
jgi:hypothetical protein